MRFYAVRTEAIELTHQALQKLDQGRKGSGRASRALRVATLYGHLQCRAQSGQPIRLGCRDLARAWHLQPRELRADLQDLAAIGWLSYTSSRAGLCIRLHEPAGALPAATAALADGMAAESNSPEPQAEPERRPALSELINEFAALYNQQKPPTWPVYRPTGTALASRLQHAIRQAGGAAAFKAVLRRALQRMPQFWRVTYPQGRSGSDCAMALLSADRKAAGLGVEFWHVFSWGSEGGEAGCPWAYTQRHSGDIRGNTPAVGSGRAAASNHPDFERARKLLVWGDHAWRCQGMEAFDLPASEKQRLAELLEAAGLGEPGHAAEQFAQETRR